jgi:hypothetical protein
LGLLAHNNCPVEEFDVRALREFRGPGTKGDKLTGHELLQGAFLRQHLDVGRSSALGGQNPAIALNQTQHKIVSALQAEAGLHSPNIIARQSARQNVLENVQILKEANVPGDAILELLVKTRKFIQDVGL